MACYSPLKGYKDLSNGGLVFKNTGIKMEVACGQCLGCRTDRVAMWAMRIVHEASLHENQHGNCFITLTYRDPDQCTEDQYRKGHYIPGDGSLRPEDIRNFWKRLRKANPEHAIRYFQCGEYGSESWRPHHHACIFNHQFNDLVVYKDIEGVVTYESESLQKLWPYGFCTVSELNYKTAAYTAGYVLKKITGHRAEEHYLRCDDYGVAYWLKPEYVTMSRRPGIGYKWYETFQTDVFPSDTTPILGESRISQQVPRYYEEILKETNPDLHEFVKAERQKFIKAHRDDFLPHRLKAKYDCHKAKQDRQNQRNAI